MLTASNRVCELFDEAFDAQKTYLIGLNNYRASLKDVSAREAEIRVIMRDRDIFVSRVSAGCFHGIDGLGRANYIQPV